MKNNNTDNRNSKQTKNDVVNHIKIDLRKVGWLSKILKSENMTHLKDVACVGCHVCNALTDKMIEECLSTNVEFAVCGCCHGSISKQGRSMKQSAKELGVSLGLFVDTTRFGIIANRKGFIAKLRTIDTKITPENRILIGSDGPKDNVIKIRPPLTIELEDAEMLVSTLSEVLEGTEDWT